MKVVKVNSYEEMSAYIAERIACQIKEKPQSVLGLATGSTPVGAYEKLCEMYKENKVDFSCVTTFNLDEYYPINPDDKNSYRYFMEEKLFSKVNIKKENINIPSGNAPDAALECKLYDEKLEKSGGVDLQILGIGVNGHIGFNEPADTLCSGTHLTELAKETIASNSRFFKNELEVPTHAITMGIGSIMKAKSIIIAANIKDKKEAVEKVLGGNITTSCPATLLCAHRDVTLVYYG